MLVIFSEKFCEESWLLFHLCFCFHSLLQVFEFFFLGIAAPGRFFLTEMAATGTQTHTAPSPPEKVASELDNRRCVAGPGFAW